jgi:hypothetical protein
LIGLYLLMPAVGVFDAFDLNQLIDGCFIPFGRRQTAAGTLENAVSNKVSVGFGLVLRVTQLIKCSVESAGYA